MGDIWDEAELIETTNSNISGKSIWDEAELVQSAPTPLTGGIKENIYNYNHNNNKLRDNFRQAGRGIARAILPEKAESWVLGNKEDEKFLKNYSNSNIPTYQELQEDYANGKISKQELIEGSNLRNKIDILSAESEYRDVRNTNIGKGVIDIGSSFIPVGAGAKMVTKGAKFLKPMVGRKTAEYMTKSAIGGLVGAGAHGLGYGLVDENINPLKNAVIEGAFGFGLGGAFGLAGSKIKQKIVANQLKKLAGKERLNADEKLQKIKLSNKYYRDYEQGIKTTRNDIGDVILNSDGFKETNIQKPKYSDKVIGLSKNIKKADYLRLENPKHPHKYKITKFHRLHGDDVDYLVAENDKGKKYFHKVTDSDLTGPKPEGQSLSDNIINDVSGNFNPNVKFKNSQLPKGADLPNEISQSIKNNPPEYQVLHNKNLINEAEKIVDKNQNDLLASLLQRASNNEENFSALDFENARQIISKLYQEGRLDEALLLTKEISKKGSKAGQAVQSMSLWAKTTPEGAVRQAQNIIKEFNRTNKKQLSDLTEQQANEIINLANNIQKVETGRAKDVATAQLMKYFANLVPQSSGNKLKSLRNISLLFNPKTFSRNIAGNTIFSGIDNFVAKPLAAGIDKFSGLFTGKRTRTLPQLKEYSQGMIKGFNEGAEDVRLGIDTRQGIGGRFDLPQKRSFNDPILGSLETALDYSLRVPDRAFYQATLDESIANQMKATGMKEVTNEMLDIANKEALEAVYQNNSKLGDTVLNLRKALNKNGLKDFGLGDALIPYAQTPANVVQQGINFSPLGMVNAVNNGLKGNQRQATLDVSRALTGSSLMGLGYAGAKHGIINPAIEDYKVRKNYEAMGIRPNTINLPNGKNMSYTQLQPLSAPIAGGAVLADISNGNYMQALDKSIGTVADLSMLRGLNSFTSDYNEKGLGTAFVNLGLSLPSQYVGTGINQINAFVDPYQREIYDPNPLKQSFNQIVNKLPLASKTLPLRYDVTGNPMKKYQSDGLQKAVDVLFNPVFVNKEVNNPTLNEMTKLYEQTGEKTSLMPIADRKIQYTDSQGQKVNKQLSGEELSRYQHEAGKIYNNLATKALTSEDFQNMDDTEKIKYLNDIKQSMNEAIKIYRYGHKPSRKYKKYTQYIIDNYNTLVND